MSMWLLSHSPRHQHLLLALPLNILLMIRQRYIEIKRLIPLIKSQPNESMISPPILDLQHEVPRRVLPLPREHEAGGEELSGVGILEPDLAPLAARHDAEAADPDLVGLPLLAAFVSAAGGSRRDLVHRDLADGQESVLERLLVVERRHGRRGIWIVIASKI